MGKLYSFISALLLTIGVSFASDLISYEYWFDNDYASKIEGSIAERSNSINLDIANPPKGAHFFNCRVGYSDGNWGSVFRKMMLNLNDSKAAAYEYWIDNDYDSKTAGRLASGDNIFEIQLEGYRKGLHCINYRLQSEGGNWGAVYTKYFYSFSNEAPFTEYEYWLDNDYANRVSTPATSNMVSLDVNLSGFDKSGGDHYFNLRGRDVNGEWSPIYRKPIIFNGFEKGVPIIGYRHYVNEYDLGYVQVNRTFPEDFSFEFNLPSRDKFMDWSDVDSSEEGMQENTDSICYTLQLQTELGWATPVSWDLVLPKLTSAPVRIKYNGRYIAMESDDEGAEIKYWLDGEAPSSSQVYSEEFDVNGIHILNAKSVKTGYLDSGITEFSVDYYADEDHAVTIAGGLLESAFEWGGTDLANAIESFSVEGVLDNSDYSYLNSMQGLHHLDIENVKDAHIPDNAFLDSRLISVSLPEDFTEYGDSILSSAPNLSSVIWNSKTLNLENRLTDGLANPNVLLYVPSGVTVANPRNLNVITNGSTGDVRLHYGHPYFAARNFHADSVCLTREFQQLTEIGGCSGWETLVLPFKPKSIVHAVNGAAVPFAAWDGNRDGMIPFWLYTSTVDGWEKAAAIEACVPYIISMPNNPDYVYTWNLGGSVTFSATDVDLGPDTNTPYVSDWKEGTEFVGTFLPVEEEGILSLNVNAKGDDLLPGSTFVPNGMTPPFGAYVRGASTRKGMPVFDDANGVFLPAVIGDGLYVEPLAPGMLKISSDRERKVTVTTATGVTLRTLNMNADESVTLDGLTGGLYIVGGVKVMVR